MLVSRQITEAVQFEPGRSIRGQFGVDFILPLIAFLNPKKGWTISSKLGESPAYFVTCKSGDKRCPKSGDTICEETVKLGFSPRGKADFAFACHAGRCEFESRPSRTNPQESNLEGFSLHVTPRQITQTLYASVINQKQGILPMSNVPLLVTSDRIGDNSRQMEKQNENQKSSKKHS